MNPSDAEIVILVGSQKGKTRKFAKLLFEFLKANNEQVYLDSMNNYQQFPAMKELLVLTSTYGDGEAPANASDFLKLFNKFKQDQSIRFNVLGFGSKKYPKFCHFAKEVQKMLSQKEGFVQGLKPTYVNKNNKQTIALWTKQWGELMGFDIALKEQKQGKKEKLQRFKIKEKRSVGKQQADTFFMRLKSKRRKRFQPGDLLCITPEGESEERQYSVGKTAKGELLLAVKKHEKGKVSPMLTGIKLKKSFYAKHQRNIHFHLPKKANKVIMIANGTGVAPFIGMMHEKKFKAKRIMYYGMRTKECLKPLKSEIGKALKKKRLNEFHTAASQEKSKSIYVQNLIERDGKKIVKSLEKGAHIMLCGSLAMQKGVFVTLSKLLDEMGSMPLEFYRLKGQIHSDCY